jgi:hypothetical protein
VVLYTFWPALYPENVTQITCGSLSLIVASVR